MKDPSVLSARTVGDPFAELLLDALPGEAAAARLIDLRVGPFWSVVHTSLGAGMASTMAREACPHGEFPIAAAGRLHEWRPLELAGLVRSSSVAEAAVGLATVNAMIPPPAAPVSEANAEAIIRSRGGTGRVAVVGHFPFVDRLRDQVGELWVFERESVRRHGEYGAEDMARLLPRAEVVAITATTILNHTLEGILSHVAGDAFVLLLGPSTPFAPALFERGLDVLCGSVILDPVAVLREASQGAVTRQIRAVRRIAWWRHEAVRARFSGD